MEAGSSGSIPPINEQLRSQLQSYAREKNLKFVAEFLQIENLSTFTEASSPKASHHFSESPLSIPPGEERLKHRLLTILKQVTQKAPLQPLPEQKNLLKELNETIGGEEGALETRVARAQEQYEILRSPKNQELLESAEITLALYRLPQELRKIEEILENNPSEIDLEQTLEDFNRIIYPYKDHLTNPEDLLRVESLKQRLCQNRVKTAQIAPSALKKEDTSIYLTKTEFKTACTNLISFLKAKKGLLTSQEIKDAKNEIKKIERSAIELKKTLPSNERLSLLVTKNKTIIKFEKALKTYQEQKSTSLKDTKISFNPHLPEEIAKHLEEQIVHIKTHLTHLKAESTLYAKELPPPQEIPNLHESKENLWLSLKLRGLDEKLENSIRDDEATPPNSDVLSVVEEAIPLLQVEKRTATDIRHLQDIMRRLALNGENALFWAELILNKIEENYAHSLNHLTKEKIKLWLYCKLNGLDSKIPQLQHKKLITNPQLPEIDQVIQLLTQNTRSEEELDSINNILTGLRNPSIKDSTLKNLRKALSKIIQDKLDDISLSPSPTSSLSTTSAAFDDEEKT